MEPVSVLLPVRDAQGLPPRAFATAIRSTLRSRDVDLDVVVVDHGSIDETPHLLAAWAARDSRLRVIRVARGASLAEAVEAGRLACATRFIARMDADDVMHPWRLREDIAWLLARPRTAAVASWTRAVPRGSRAMRSYLQWQNSVLDAAGHAREIWIEQPLCNPSTTFRAEALADVGGYQSGPWPEDYQLLLRLVLSGWDVEKRPILRHGWRQHAAMTTRTSSRHTRDEVAALKAIFLVSHYRLTNRAIVVLGAGKEGRRISRALRAAGAQVAAFVDVSPARIGRECHGVRVMPTPDLAAWHGVHAGAFGIGAVGTSGSRGTVRAVLDAAGFVEGQDAVVVS